ncbi:hypothetical protein BB561_003983 [Smittium simulii]|uniref:FAD-dependent oxidoreductase 2 FAD-binding domain-containing protein n=1 Tax=Smittium simulii TaxID=133385 RepID=A0A2T9YIT3_9FUNG|nr:hypothetical protein BB561_003983 [Smittium simulii]
MPRLQRFSIVTALTTVIFLSSFIALLFTRTSLQLYLPGTLRAYLPESLKQLRQHNTRAKMNYNPELVIVVGGGLAGMSAATEAYLNNSKTFVAIFDKEPRLGGNSAKASSGINGVNTKTQLSIHENDSFELFEKDTLASGKGNSAHSLVQKLVLDSKSSVTWLQDFFKLDLDVLAKLGGHSAKRTHRRPDLPDGRPQPVGFGITKAISDWLSSQIEVSQERLKIHTKTRVTNLLKNKQGHVIGIEYTEGDSKNQEIKQLLGKAVILTTGGYAGEGTNSVLLKKYADKYYGLPTTNGAFATGDGISLGQKAGAGLVDMQYIQVHPTGFVNSKDPNSQTKFLAAESMRGEGGILLDISGKRFANELLTRDALTEAIWTKANNPELLNKVYNATNTDKNVPKNKQFGSVAFLVLSQDSATKFGLGALSFYSKMGLINKVDSLQELASALKVNKETILAEFIKYEAAKIGLIKDEFGKTSFPASLIGQVNSNIHELIKKVDWDSENNLENKLKSLSFSEIKDVKYYWGVITPSLHYTMGGLMFNEHANVLKSDGTLIKGLFAAGEVTGGLHGKNRLGGNSLLECVVYGREAGRQACNYKNAL